MKLMSLVLIIIVVAACSESPTPPRATTPTATCAPADVSIDTLAQVAEFGYRVINTYPHNDQAFTQGLIWVDSALVEGTGFYLGPAHLWRLDLVTGSTLQERIVPLRAFGEGVTQFGDRIYQLTFTEQRCFVYDAATFDSLTTFTYTTQGWGLTHDGSELIMSDGTDQLYFRDPATFAQTRRVTVTDNGTPRNNINELEYIDGLVYANIFQSVEIVIIDPANGRVVGRIDGTGLHALAGVLTSNVLNGIAWDTEGCRLFVTGKLWPKLFEIELVRQ